MSHIRKKTIEGLSEGDRFSVTRTFHETDVVLFAEMTKDYNPVHFDTGFVKAKGFRGRICHGMLVGSMISEIGGQIGWLASEMQFQFKKPVYFGDTVTCEMTITQISEKGWATATGEYRNQEGTIVMEALLKGILPGMEEKRAMQKILWEQTSC